MDDIYTGDVVFVEGVHYPVDEDGHADTSRPLRWTEGGYRDEQAGEALHNDVHHKNEVGLEIGGE